MAKSGDGAGGGVGGPEVAASPMSEILKRVGSAAQWSGIAAVVVFAPAAGGFFELFTAILAGLYAVVGSYGLAIILLTIIVRLLLLPLSIKQVQSQREMQKIQPEIAKLRKKYKDDRQKQSEEQMKLFKEHGVNPAAGCLPLVLQFPVFIALFRVLQRPTAYMGEAAGSALDLGLRSAPQAVNGFLGFHLDCTAANVTGIQLPLSPVTGSQPWCATGIVASIPYVAIVVLTALTTYITQRQMQATQPDSQQAQQMQAMMKFFPVMFILFGWGFPAGLGIYWLTTNVLSAGQQYLMLNYWAPPLQPGQAKGSPAEGSSAKDSKAKDSKDSKAKGSKAKGRSSGNPAQSKGPKASPPKGAADGARPSPRSTPGATGKRKRRK